MLFSSITMAPKFYTRRSLCVNTPANLVEKLDEIAGAQDPAIKSNAGSNEAFTKVPTLPEAPTLPLAPLPTEDLFTKFIKVFIKTTQAQALAEQQERLFKARILETYSGKSHMDCYYFCQQYEEYFETSGTIRMNCTLFAAIFFCGTVSFRWAQLKYRHKSATLIMWSNFKVFFRKDLRNSQAFIDSIWSKFRRDS